MQTLKLSNGTEVILGACCVCGERENIELLDSWADWDEDPMAEGKLYCIRCYPEQGGWAYAVPSAFGRVASQTLMEDYERHIETLPNRVLARTLADELTKSRS